MTRLENIVELLRKMEGVIEIFPVNGEILNRLRQIESNVKATLDLDVKNTGLEECLRRKNIICIIKDGRFRPPPQPTVLLMGDDDIIMGKEIIPSDTYDYHQDDETVFLSDDFVLFRNKKPRCKEYFVMPPVSFPEVEEIEGVSGVVSCSPSPLGDLALRTAHGLRDDPKLASILIGFDVE